LKTEPNHKNQFSLQALIKLSIKFSNSFEIFMTRKKVEERGRREKQRS